MTHFTQTCRKSSLAAVALILTACTAAPSPSYSHDSTVRIFETLASDAMQGRRAGSPGGIKARSFIIDEMRALGAFDSISEHPFTAQPRGEGGAPVQAVNIHGLIDTDDGDTGPLFVITAHYDHLGERDGEIYNGADDNASGAAALFAIAQSFMTAPPNHDVLFIWYDAEEMGLQGAKYFVAQDSFADRPVFNMNLDMVSQNTEGEIYASGSYHMPALKPILEQSAAGKDITLVFGNDRPEDGGNDWTLQSDHAEFHRAGLPFVYFGVVDHPHYHKASDTFATIPLEFYERSVELIVQAAHDLDENLDMLARARPTSE
ncbi:M28 family peptidase [Fretibacter rubidus]|uniref:M28 family peptidase n=1 Tax=Fretibacter rubidus TaxID=570162 RepID=UPI003529EEED